MAGNRTPSCAQALTAAVQWLCGRGSPSGRAQLQGEQGMPFPGMTALSEADLDCIDQRHFYRRPSLKTAAGGQAGQQLIGGGRRCRHGWPQAVLYDPLYREKPQKSSRLGDTVRLTCPLLVAAIDRYEKTGVMEKYNERLGVDEAWRRSFEGTNEAHRSLRERLVLDRPAELAEVRENLGQSTFEVAMSSGLASMRKGTWDVKCLHAQVADELVRGGNLIGQQTLRDIEEQGIIVNGTEECCDNCNVHLPLEDARWRLTKCKNSAGKRLSRSRKEPKPPRLQYES